MADLDNTPEVVETTEPTAPVEAPVEDTLLPNTDKVAEAIQKARAQEKAKLYPQLEKLQDELSLLRKEREERQALEAERNEKRKQREAEREAERKAKEEDEMSFKKLLKTKEQEWADKLEAERLERERAFALLDQERRFQELDNYRRQRLEQERENIVPELIDLISGNTQDEIENSIADLRARSAKIFDSVVQAAQQSRKDMVGTKITMPASGPLDNDSDSRTLSPNDIQNMSLADYAKNRAKLLGNSNNRGQGLFG
jgi:chromatin assembly factor 1 subunit A